MIMNPSIEYVVNTRTSVGRYDPEKSLDQKVIENLVRMATTAPSAFNLQNWRFIAVQSAEAKTRLKAVAFGQKPVSDAAVTFIVCGQLEAHRQLFRVLQPSVDRGIISSDMQQTWTDMATASHANNPQHQRDEAIRSASLAAMTLILSAQGMGLASGAIGGFDPGGVSEAFNLGANDLPVLLVTVGFPAEGNWPQKPRKSLEEVLKIC